MQWPKYKKVITWSQCAVLDLELFDNPVEGRHCCRPKLTVHLVRAHTNPASPEFLMPLNLDSTQRITTRLDAEAGSIAAELARTQADLARARDEFVTLAGRLGHDVRGLLRHIIEFAQALQQRPGEREPSEQRWLGRIETVGKRADALVADLVTLSRISVSQPDLRALDLLGLIRDCVHDALAPEIGRHIQWEIDVSATGTVGGDRALLRVALTHLLANAVKFTRPRDGARISVRSRADLGTWTVEVRDNGVGFDAEYAHRLFTVFERLHGPAEFEGNGIGLATVKAVADKHGGAVNVIGALDVGVTVTFSWPRDVVARRGAITASSGQVLAPDTSGGRSLRLLLVDDEPLVLGTLRTMIERDGHEVVTAASAAAGLQVLDAGGRKFDAVLSDWLMPGMQGPVFARAVKQRLPAVPVFLLTGQRPAADGSHARPDHVDAVLPKPLRFAELRRVLDGLTKSTKGDTKCPGQQTGGS